MHLAVLSNGIVLGSICFTQISIQVFGFKLVRATNWRMKFPNDSSYDFQGFVFSNRSMEVEKFGAPCCLIKPMGLFWGHPEVLVDWFCDCWFGKARFTPMSLANKIAKSFENKIVPRNAAFVKALKKQTCNPH